MTDTAFPLTIPHVLVRAAQLWNSEIALDDNGRCWTYSTLELDCRRAARAFLAAGIGKGDRIAIWAPNCAEWIIAAIGAQIAGGVIVPLNTRLRGKEASFILRKSRARMLLTVAGFLGTEYPALLAGEDLPALENTVLLSSSRASHESWDVFIGRGVSTPEHEIDTALATLTADDLADIMFTSGTTGDPKGVMSSHGQNVRAFVAWSDAVGLRHGDRCLIVNPFFHAFGYKAGWLSCLIRGAAIMPMAVFDAEQVMRRIATDRISVLPGPPTLFQSILAQEACGHIDVSSLRIAVTGAATVAPSLIERMRTVLGFKCVFTGYGLTESTGVVTMCRPGDSDERVAFTCGVPIAGVQIRCIDDLGREVPRGAAGEVIVRGFNVMRGYLDDPAATAEAIDADGWLHTGDVGVIDADGYLRIADRKKDMFIVGGFNCYPAEIEKIISSHPDVSQVAVVSVSDDRLGEVGKAYVVPRKDAALEATALLAWCRDNMANYKIPRFIEFTGTLPATASGKIQKFALK